MIDYQILRVYDNIPRENHEVYPYMFLRVILGDCDLEKRFLISENEVRISKLGKSTFCYGLTPFEKCIVSYNIKTPWARFYEKSYMGDMSRMIPMLHDDINMGKLFGYREDCSDLKLHNISFSHSNYKNLRYEVVENINTAFKCDDSGYLGYCKIIDNKFEKKKYLLIVDFPESSTESGFVQVISLPDMKSIIRYRYKGTINENPLMKDFPIEVNDEPMIIGIESPCIDSFEECITTDDGIIHTAFYHPYVRYIEDWDLPMDIIYEDNHVIDSGELIRTVYQMGDEAWEYVKENKKIPNFSM